MHHLGQADPVFTQHFCCDGSLPLPWPSLSLSSLSLSPCLCLSWVSLCPNIVTLSLLISIQLEITSPRLEITSLRRMSSHSLCIFLYLGVQLRAMKFSSSDTSKDLRGLLTLMLGMNFRIHIDQGPLYFANYEIKLLICYLVSLSILSQLVPRDAVQTSGD